MASLNELFASVLAHDEAMRAQFAEHAASAPGKERVEDLTEDEICGILFCAGVPLREVAGRIRFDPAGVFQAGGRWCAVCRSN